MTTQEYNVLNQIIYSDFAFQKGFDTTGSLQEICQRAVAYSSANDQSETARCIQDIADGKYPGLSNLTIKGAQNNNSTSGMVAYAFGEGSKTICAFRGSETSEHGKDWVDNFYSGLTAMNSIQYDDALAFALEMSHGINLEVTGHSKGGNIAMYVASQTEVSGGYCFNSQGFREDFFTKEEIDRLQESGMINYVTTNDYVGSLLNHYVQVQFVEGNSNNDLALSKNHALNNMKFDENGNPYPSSQSAETSFIQSISKMIRIRTYPGIPQITRRHTTSRLKDLHTAADKLQIPLDQFLSTISAYMQAQDQLQTSYRSLNRALDALEHVWKGTAYKAIRYQWDSINGNIQRADSKMSDAIMELKEIHDMFAENEKATASAFSSLDVGVSPFD